MFLMKWIIILGILYGISYFFCYPCVVEGTSMLPMFNPGETVFIRRACNKEKLNVGDIIIYRSPETTDEEPSRVVIKEITKVKLSYNHSEYHCEGVNKDASYDCRHYGSIYSDNVIAKVLFVKKGMRVS